MLALIKIYLDIFSLVDASIKIREIVDFSGIFNLWYIFILDIIKSVNIL